MSISKNFAAKVLANGMIDTRNYRYIIKCDNYGCQVLALPIKFLDTTAAYDNWKVVYTF